MGRTHTLRNMLRKEKGADALLQQREFMADGILLCMRKLAVLTSLMILLASLRAVGQIACPIVLTDGHTDRDLIRLSLRNKGKVPIEQFSLSCSPPANHKSRSAICHSQAGIFYPGTPYWITVPYTGAERGSITISVATVQLAGGDIWTSRSSDSCRTLRITQRR